MRIRRRELPAEDFQMAPMIDMVFLLLVFFMCVSSLSQAQRRVPVDLPESAESKVPDDLSDRATVTVLADGSVQFGVGALSLTELEARLRAEVAREARLRVQVRADRGVRYGEVKKVLRTCAQAGASEVIYATHQTD